MRGYLVYLRNEVGNDTYWRVKAKGPRSAKREAWRAYRDLPKRFADNAWPEPWTGGEILKDHPDVVVVP